MAEFQEVMRQWARICSAVPGKSGQYGICSDERSEYICPMYESGLCNKSVSKQTDNDRSEGEKIIMAWAKENPEPVYPTWEEYFISKGLLKPFWNENGTPPYDMYVFAERALSNRIPSYIAQKLGIEPKEGV